MSNNDNKKIQHHDKKTLYALRQDRLLVAPAPSRSNIANAPITSSEFFASEAANSEEQRFIYFKLLIKFKTIMKKYSLLSTKIH